MFSTRRVQHETCGVLRVPRRWRPVQDIIALLAAAGQSQQEVIETQARRGTCDLDPSKQRDPSRVIVLSCSTGPSESDVDRLVDHLTCGEIQDPCFAKTE